MSFCHGCGCPCDKVYCPKCKKARAVAKKNNWHSKAARDKAVMHRLILRLKINGVKEGGRR